MALTESESVITTTRLPRDAPGRAEHLVEHVRIGRINGDDHVRLELVEEPAKLILEREEDPEIAGESLLPIEPAIDGAPRHWATG